MRKAFLAAAALSVALLAGTCSPKTAQGIPDTAGYEGWEKTTEEALDFPIPGHLNHFRRIYINDLGAAYRRTAAAQGLADLDYPDGTLVVKEIYGGLDEPEPGEKPISLDIMEKRRGAADALGGWRWIVVDTVQGTARVMTGDFCFTCHKGANERHPYGDKNPEGRRRDFLFY